jgi:hypothetical protein
MAKVTSIHVAVNTPTLATIAMDLCIVQLAMATALNRVLEALA